MIQVSAEQAANFDRKIVFYNFKMEFLNLAALKL